MGDKSKIEWTDASWNPIVGCSIVSPGCTNCYAMRMASRLETMMKPERHGESILPHHYSALTEPSKGGPVWTGRVNIAPQHIMTAPLHWKKPRRIFVNSMGDLFHESVPDHWIDKVFAVMALAPQHTFQVLTKRAERMQGYCLALRARAVEVAQQAVWLGIWDDPDAIASQTCDIVDRAPLPNVWLGVSAERQQEADDRIPHLLQTPAAVRFVSAEPLLGPIDLAHIAHENGCADHYYHALDGYVIDGNQAQTEKIDWVIVGGESGPHARPMHPDYARSLRDQCAAAEVPYFFKQWGEFAYSNAIGVPVITSKRVGTARAGRLLDGFEHNAFPTDVRQQ